MYDAGNTLEDGLDAPEASAAENNLFCHTRK
jgi:hypothetical protein